MRETRSSGSVEGVMSNRDPYSDSDRVLANTQNLPQKGPFYNALSRLVGSGRFRSGRVPKVLRR